jgi:NADPH:quinone reductase-like Zn-dependent oxidoreductase
VKAVRFDNYGGLDVLDVREVDDPVAGPGEVLVAVKAASINPGEIAIREGYLDDRWPATFPSGEGTDFAGIIQALGQGVDEFALRDEVLGWTEMRASQAELVVAPTIQITVKPAGLAWEVAGSLFVAPMAAYACVQAVDPKPGEVVVVSAAAGGVGSVAVQLAHRTGATVVGLASERNHAWLRDRGVIPVTYGEGQAERIKQAAGAQIDAFIDTFGGGYVEMAINELGVPAERINTIADFDAIARLGVNGQGSHAVGTREILAELAELAAAGELEIPIANTYPLSDVRAAFEELSTRSTHGKIVLLP